MTTWTSYLGRSASCPFVVGGPCGTGTLSTLTNGLGGLGALAAAAAAADIAAAAVGELEWLRMLFEGMRGGGTPGMVPAGELLLLLELWFSMGLWLGGLYMLLCAG